MLHESIGMPNEDSQPRFAREPRERRLIRG